VRSGVLRWLAVLGMSTRFGISQPAADAER